MYPQAAHDVGQIIAERKDVLVYGGGSPGCMGALATGCLSHGGTVIGIIPRFFIENEPPMEALTKPPHSLIYVENMSERKCRMFRTADAVITLPGGWGSLDEFFEDITDSKLVHFTKAQPRPHVLVNLGGYWDPLIAVIHRVVEKKFGRLPDTLKIVESVDQIFPKLDEMMYGPNVRTLAAG